MFGTQSIFKPEGKKLRRKLQKLNNRSSLQPQAKSTVQFPQPAAVSHISLEPRQKSASHSHLPPAPSPTSPLLVLPPDLSDAKWQEYVRRSGYQLQPMLKEPALRTSQVIIPEFAHLSLDNLPPRQPSDAGSADSDASTATSASTPLGRRRQAKTPIHSIGQLEQQPGQAEGQTTDLERLAESYRVLLDSRNSLLASRNTNRSPSVYEDCPEPLPEAQSYQQATETPTHLAVPPVTPRSPRSPRSIRGSPATSDDGTLIGYEDVNTIYFKPADLDTIPATPQEEQERRLARQSALTAASMEDPSLNICFDLLSRELSAVSKDMQHHAGDGTSPLQIWVMIEAYEKLRGQVLKRTRDPNQARSLEVMFEMWLGALHHAYEQMDGLQDQRSVSEYGE